MFSWWLKSTSRVIRVRVVGPSFLGHQCLPQSDIRGRVTWIDTSLKVLPLGSERSMDQALQCLKLIKPCLSSFVDVASQALSLLSFEFCVTLSGNPEVSCFLCLLEQQFVSNQEATLKSAKTVVFHFQAKKNQLAMDNHWWC